MRISADEWGLRLAETTSLRGTCLRRQVGCVLVDGRGKVLATGYNGVASGMAHCNEPTTCDGKFSYACVGAGMASGTGLDACEAIHAEQNCIAFCRDVDLIHTAYVTIECCVPCTKLLLGTGCRRIVFRDPYAGAGGSRALWEKSGRIWQHGSMEDQQRRKVTCLLQDNVTST